MKLACFYPASVYCAWCVSTGLVDTLRRLGHEVAALPVDHTQTQLNLGSYPARAQLEKFDGIVLSGPEHLRGHILALYPEWCKLSVPKVSWMHETVEREDYGRLPIEAIQRLADTTFCPAAQDERYGLRWLPFGVDTEVFKPNWNQTKTYQAAFIGLIYPKRAEFLKKVIPHLKGINFMIGNVQVQDLGGICVHETAALYADNLRRIKVFVNLPTLSQLAVTKVYEVLACGTFLITPRIAEARNFDNLQAHFYDPSKPESLAESIRFCLQEEEQRIAATRVCCQQVHGLHRLELRCQTLLAALAEQSGANQLATPGRDEVAFARAAGK